MRKFKNLFLVCGVIGFLILAVGSMDTEKEAEKEVTTTGDTTTDKKEETKKEVKAFKIGDNIKLDKVVYTVNSIRESSGYEFDKPKDGNKFVLIDVTVENKSEKSQNVSSILMFKLQDSKAYSYNTTFLSGQKGQIDGEVIAGASLRGELSFEVPSTETQLKLNVDPSIFGNGKFVVELY